LSGLPRRFHAARYHSLIVEEHSLPPALAITARGPGGIPMGLRHARHPVEGLQFHPESILTTHGNQIILNLARIVRSQSRGTGRTDSEICEQLASPADFIHDLGACRDHRPQLPAGHDLGCPGGGGPGQPGDLFDADPAMAH
jgi:hypothetical protein